MRATVDEIPGSSGLAVVSLGLGLGAGVGSVVTAALVDQFSVVVMGGVLGVTAVLLSIVMSAVVHTVFGRRGRHC